MSYISHPLILFLLDVFTKMQEVTISFVMSVCPSVSPHGTTWLPMDAFSQNLIFVRFLNVKKIQA
jgi:hypothetical protein